MSELATEQAESITFKEKHQFLLFISLSIFVALVIVAISMAMYNGSGAAQLDLSRPGYKSVRSQAGKDDADFQTFPASGSMSKDVISNFEATYDKQAEKIKTVDAFKGDPLSAEALGINAVSSATQ
jgi:hypothetical protein